MRGGDTGCCLPLLFPGGPGRVPRLAAPFSAGGGGAEPAHLLPGEQRAGWAPGGAWWGKGRGLGAPEAASSMRQGGACLLRGAVFPLPQPFCSMAAML